MNSIYSILFLSNSINRKFRNIIIILLTTNCQLIKIKKHNIIYETMLLFFTCVVLYCWKVYTRERFSRHYWFDIERLQLQQNLSSSKWMLKRPIELNQTFLSVRTNYLNNIYFYVATFLVGFGAWVKAAGTMYVHVKLNQQTQY